MCSSTGLYLLLQNTISRSASADSESTGVPPTWFSCLGNSRKKCREQNKGLYITFVDLSKAFDTVSRKGPLQIMERLGCPPKFLSIVMRLHEDQRGQVRNNELSEPFPILNRVKQGCVLAPTLFTIFFNMMLQRATEDLSDDDGIYIRYRTDGSQFILRHLQAHTKTLEYLVQELLFADDAALVAHTENALQRVKSCFAEAAQLSVSKSAEEDRGSSSARPQGNVLPTPHHNWRDRTEGSPAVHLPRVHHLLRRKNRQRGE